MRLCATDKALLLLVAGVVAFALTGCSGDNPVVGHLQKDPCEMPPCPAGSYCPQQCP